MGYDLLGLALPFLMLIAAYVGFVTVAAASGDVHRAVYGGADVAFYGTLATFFFYVPYATGYIAFRIAALAGTPSASFLVALGTLACAILVGLTFAAAERFTASVALAAVLGIPALGGVIAVLAQMAAMPRRELPAIPE